MLNIHNLLDPNRLSDSQRSITAARSCERWVVLNFQDKAIAQIQNSGIFDFDVLVQVERAREEVAQSV